MRFVHLSAALGVFLGTVQACALFIPFDEYWSGVETPPDEGVDATADASSVDADADADAPPDPCEGINTSTDPLNCGACGRRCAGDGGCQGGRCPVETVLDAGAPVFDLSVMESPDGGSNPVVYFTAANGAVGQHFVEEGTRFEVSNAGATGELSLISGGGNRGYFARGGTLASFVVPTFTKPPELMANTASGLGPITHERKLAFWGDDAGLWWKDTNVPARDGGIFGLYDASPPPVAFAISSEILFWAAADGTVREMQTGAPGTPKLVQPNPIGLVTAIGVRRQPSKTMIYLCQPSQGLLVFEQQSTGTTQLVTQPMDECAAIAVTSTHIYAVNFGRADVNPRKFGELWRMLPDGTKPILIANQLTSTRALGVYGEFVYFGTGNTVVRTPR